MSLPPPPFPYIASGFCPQAGKKTHEMKANLKVDLRVDGAGRGGEKNGGMGLNERGTLSMYGKG